MQLAWNFFKAGASFTPIFKICHLNLLQPPKAQKILFTIYKVNICIVQILVVQIF